MEFGRLLIESGDLDPLYIVLWEAKFPRPKLCDWLVSYWCFYHAGLSCWIVDQPVYWEAMLEVPKGGTLYPRGSERRHFRDGPKSSFASNTVRNLQQKFGTAEKFIDWLGTGDLRAPAIAKKVKSLYGFGEWISGKIPDMVQRLGLIESKFEDRDVDMMFDSPKKGAQEVARIHAPSTDPLMSAHKFLLEQFTGLLASPRYERVLNVQETETVFCKWKSHLSGHYPPGKDTIEIMHGLEKYKSCPSSQVLIKELQKVQQKVNQTLS